MIMPIIERIHEEALPWRIQQLYEGLARWRYFAFHYGIILILAAQVEPACHLL